MQVVVTDECHAGDDLREDVEAAAKEVADAVEDVSGLSLPAVANVRLVTPQEYREVNRQMMAAVFATLVQRHPDLPPKQVEITRVAAGVVSRLTMGMFWRGIGGQYIPQVGDTTPQVLIMPKALRLSRATARERRVILAHELTHGAQDRACPMLTVDAIAQVVAIPPKDVRAEKKKLAQVSPVIEGHAQWVHLRVCNAMYGLDMRSRDHRFDGKGALSYRLSKSMASHNPVMAAKAGDYDRGEKFIDYVHGVGGLPMVNRLWQNLASIPDGTELETPELWIKRVGNAA